jgi:phosphoglycolate phosphatase-like HAD superfamily hydrolase
MALRGVIFDLDGTLGDTLPVCLGAFRQVFHQYLGREFSDAEIGALFGPTEEGILQSLVPVEWHAALQAYLAAYARLHPERGAPIPGISDLVQWLNDQGVAAAVVTAKGPVITSISLGALGLAHLFDIVETGSPSGAVKPEAISRVLSRWGFAPGQVCYVGDAASDVRAARQAGVRSVGAAWAPGTPLEPLRAAGPDEVFETVAAFAEWLTSVV